MNDPGELEDTGGLLDLLVQYVLATQSYNSTMLEAICKKLWVSTWKGTTTKPKSTSTA